MNRGCLGPGRANDRVSPPSITYHKSPGVEPPTNHQRRAGIDFVTRHLALGHQNLTNYSLQTSREVWCAPVFH